jgi:hypothetical protein
MVSGTKMNHTWRRSSQVLGAERIEKRRKIVIVLVVSLLPCPKEERDGIVNRVWLAVVEALAHQSASWLSGWSSS